MEDNITFEISSNSTHFNENLFGTLQERIERIQNANIPLVADESTNNWSIYDEYFSQTYFVNFDFEALSSKQFDTEYFISLLKSWFILLIENSYSFNHVTRKIRKIKEALILSKGFNLLKINDFERDYFNNNLELNTLQSKAACILEFIDFCQEFIVPEEYFEMILGYYQIKTSNSIRKLPSSHDVLKFSLLVETYFEKEQKNTEYWDYYPIYLWWTITNIIPIRINEFCSLKFDCLIESDEGFFLTLPRSKNVRNKKINYDKILISDRVADSIKLYQQKVTFGKQTKTLLQITSTSKNNKPEVFNYRNFTGLLDKFYKKIICEKYKFKLIEDNTAAYTETPYNLHRKIRPNDTRHFAFLNLMLQGYHPSEIARLGGHNSIYSQMSYHSHLEYWVDSDLIKLIMNQNRCLNKLLNEFYKERIFKSTLSTTTEVSEAVHIPLEIGYCTDPLQDCPVDEHYLCKHWRITFDDYQKHHDKLHSIIITQESVLKLCIDKLLNLHKTGLIHHKNNLYDEKNSEFNYQLIESSKAVKSALYQLAKLKERVENYEK